MFLRKRDALRRARHGAIVVGQFTQNTRRFEACQAYQIDSRFGVTTTGQYTAWLCAQREYVARTVQVGRFRVIGDCRTNGGQAVSGGNAGGDAVCRFNSDGKTGAVGAGVIFHHHRQIQLFTAFVGQTQTNDAATVTDSQRHLFNGHVFGGKDHVAFVLTIFIVQHHRAAAFAQGNQCVFNAFKRSTKRGK